MQPESETATGIFTVDNADKGLFCLRAVISLFGSQ